MRLIFHILLKEDNVPICQMVSTLKAIPDKNRKVRVVEVKVKSGTYLRSVTKVAVVPIFDQS